MSRRSASPETDRALLSRAHEAMGRIYAFMDKRAEALREFDEAIKIDRNEIKRKFFPITERQSLNDSFWLADGGI